MTVGIDRAKELLETIKTQRILVVGDVMLDRYIHGEVYRISPEAPVPVVQVSHEIEVPGGASNVALNLAALQSSSSLAGFTGCDKDGDALADLLRKQGVDTSLLARLENYRTTVKTRILAERQQVVRIDWDQELELSPEHSYAFCQTLAEQMSEVDAVVVEDYGKGTISQAVLDCLAEAASKAGVPIGIDPKDNHDLQFNSLTVATPNRKEAFHAAGITESLPGEHPLEDQALLKVAGILREKWHTQNLLITLGAQGMLLISDSEEPLHVSTRAKEVYDVSGAGDTVIAVWMATLAAGGSLLEACELANAAAGVVVSKLGTATMTAEEILDVLA